MLYLVWEVLKPQANEWRKKLKKKKNRARHQLVVTSNPLSSYFSDMVSLQRP